jgi:hypothetical protein
MRRFAFLVTAAILLCSTADAAEPRMTKIVTRAISPDIKPGSFAAKPKTMYLAGKKYARVEEDVDIENKIHGLIIANEPDSWIINLVDKPDAILLILALRSLCIRRYSGHPSAPKY